MNIFRSKKNGVLIIALFGLFAMQSCVKDLDPSKLEKINYTPIVALPLVYSTQTIGDLLLKNNNGLVVVNDSSFCTIIYKNTLFSLRADSIIKLPTQQFPSYSAGLTPAQAASLGSTGSIIANYSQTINFNSGSGSTLIDSLTLKGGNLNITLNSQFPYSGNIVVKIPSATLNGATFAQIIPINYTGTLPIVVNSTFNLSGYDVNMTNGGTTSNQFVVDYSVTLTGSGAPLTTDSISLTGSLNTLQFKKIFGDVGQFSLFPVVNQDTIGISIFQNSIGSGTFTIANPVLKVTIYNSYGVPIDANLPVLEGFTPPGSTYPLTGVPSPIPVLSPTFAQIGQTLIDSFSLTKTNSNIATVVNHTPKNFIYSGNGTTNPAGPTHNNFVLDTSVCQVAVEADLPLYGTASNFVLQDTLKFSMPSFATSNIESFLFKMYTLNGMPIDVNMQIYFTDSLYHKLDSLVIPNQLILKSGILNSVGYVIAPTANTYVATVSKARLANLGNTKYLIIKDVETTTNGGKTNVKIYANYSVLLQLGVEAQLQIKS